MNKRVVLGFLVAGGLGIGLFSAAERVMRGAGQTVVRHPAPPPVDPEKPVEIVTVPQKKKPVAAAESRPAAPVAAVRTSPQAPPRGEVARWEEPRPVQATTVAPPRAASGVKIDRLVLCLAVKDRNPANEVASVPSDVGKVFAWLRVSGASGRKVRTVWTVNGKSSPGTWLNVGSNQWRTWASKRIDASMKGSARVEVQDDKGNVLASKEFTITGR
ncbi:MAG: DUF2914 domain-containing protein [Planctomycetes bacterium]|nr:DUF2914 domain-containing protein [Planctomycetota bacterium]